MKYILYIFIIFILLPVGCRQKTPLDEKEIGRIREELNSSRETKRQAIIELEAFYEDMDDEQKAIYGYTLGEQLASSRFIHEIKILQGNPDKYIDFALGYYTKNKHLKKQAYCYMGKGIIARYNRSYQAAIEAFLDALELAKEIKDNQLLGRTYHQLSVLSGYQSETEKSIEYMHTAIHYFQQCGDKEGEAKMNLSLGWAHTSMEKDEEALAYAFKALELSNDSITKGEALLDIGNSYQYMEKFDSALYYMYQSIQYPSIHTMQATRYTKIAHTYAHLGEADSAYLYAKKALQLPIDIYFEQACYRILTVLLADMGDKNEELASLVAKEKATQDSIMILERQPNIGMLEQLRTLDRQTLKVKTHRSYLLYGILFLICISGLSIIYLSKQHRKKEKEANIYKSQLEEKEEIIDIQQEELEKQYERSLSDLKDELKRTKEKYASKRAKSNFEQRQKIDLTVYNEVFYLNDEDAFRKKMNHVLNGLPDKLKEDYPEISEKEILWCCLFMLQLSSNDIAFILDYKQTSLYKFKQRLIKKLGFTTAKELEQMLYNKVNL